MSQTTIMVTRIPPRSLVERLWHHAVGFMHDAVAAQRLGRERELLAELSDAALKDIGLTQADVWAELHKPIWRR